MSERKDENDVFRFEEVVECDISAFAIRDQEFAKPGLYEAPNQWMPLERPDSLADVVDRLCSSAGILFSEEIEQPLEIR